MTPSARVFVVGGYMPFGGARMAYEVALIAARSLAAEPVTVQVRGETAEGSVFAYSRVAPVVPLSSLDGEVRSDDLVICNPSFSGHMLGLRLRGRKVMYLQGFNTFAVIDGFYDHYVAVSSYVAGLVSAAYGIATRVIPGFADDGAFAPAPAWQERDPGAVFVHRKLHGDFFLNQFKRRFTDRYPGLDRKFVVANGRLNQREYFELLGRFRYFLTLSPFEGFGLPALEAMARGCTVIGFDGGGGRDFLRPANSDTVAYPRLDGAVDALARVLRDDELAGRLATTARSDARTFAYPVFEERWTAFFREHFDTGSLA